VLSELDGVRAIHINSSTLQRLGVCTDLRDAPEEMLQEVIIEDAPLLEKLLLSGTDEDISIRVICAPKLDFLGSLPEGFSKTKLETTFFQVITTFHFSIKDASRRVYSICLMNLCANHSYILLNSENFCCQPDECGANSQSFDFAHVTSQC
jgi:hypothetical protein